MTRISKNPSLVHLVAVVGMLWSAVAGAETLDCDRLAGSHQMLCVAMTRCSMLDGPDARSGCVSAVLQAVGVAQPPARQSSPSAAVSGPSPAPAQSPSEAPSPAQTSEPARPQTVTQSSRAVEPKSVPRTVMAPADRVEQQSVTRAATARPERDVSEDAGKLMSGDEIPKKFTATVVATLGLIRDRQIVLLDNDLAFEGEGPEFDIGDEVNVNKRGFFGDAYTITSRKSRPKVFGRLRCEDTRRSAETERKCAALMDR
ncbi:MAG: hypothetical protein O2780_17610 [Proteobacteria bacterium]|nr:hypothetical protein [Pseudomonadota bacterium]